MENLHRATGRGLCSKGSREGGGLPPGNFEILVEMIVAHFQLKLRYSGKQS